MTEAQRFAILFHDIEAILQSHYEDNRLSNAGADDFEVLSRVKNTIHAFDQQNRRSTWIFESSDELFCILALSIHSPAVSLVPFISASFFQPETSDPDYDSEKVLAFKQKVIETLWTWKQFSWNVLYRAVEDTYQVLIETNDPYSSDISMNITFPFSTNKPLNVVFGNNDTSDIEASFRELVRSVEELLPILVQQFYVIFKAEQPLQLIEIMESNRLDENGPTATAI